MKTHYLLLELTEEARTMRNLAAMTSRGSPMLQPIVDNKYMGNMPTRDVYEAGMVNGAVQEPGATGGNHAQTHMMLLEQQNKKRLMMAPQEQNDISRDGGPTPRYWQSEMGRLNNDSQALRTLNKNFLRECETEESRRAAEEQRAADARRLRELSCGL